MQFTNNHIRNDNIENLSNCKVSAIDKETNPCYVQYHGKIDWDVAKRILRIIHDEGKVKRTSLAMKAGLNYMSCMRYMIWLAEVKWIDIQEDNQIKLTTSGIEMCLYLIN